MSDLLSLTAFHKMYSFLSFKDDIVRQYHSTKNDDLQIAVM